MGKTQRTKGKRVELEIVHIFKRFGFDAQRIPLSGATTFQKGDVFVKNDKHEFVFEVKSRKNVSKKLQAIIEQIERGNYVVCFTQSYEYIVDSLERFAYNLQVYDKHITDDMYKVILPSPNEFEQWYNFDGLIVKVDYHQPIIAIRKNI